MKPNTFTKLYVHCIFSPRGRESLLKQPLRTKVEKYIYGIIQEKKCFPVAINGTDDHLHLLIGFGAFTVEYRELDIVYKYILNQELHHLKQTFRTEYKKVLDDESITNYDDYMSEFYD